MVQINSLASYARINFSMDLSSALHACSTNVGSEKNPQVTDESCLSPADEGDNYTVAGANEPILRKQLFPQAFPIQMKETSIQI